jgi:dinuclear metal center YbgI/SA1388 family protein
VAQLRQVVERLDSLLDPSRFQDYCVNGLQIEGRAEVSRIASGVSISLRFVEEAVAWGADALLVHHGLFWKGMPHPFHLHKGPLQRRLKEILANDLSVIAYHLPLDAHPEVGNNAVLARELGLRDRVPVEVGCAGNLPTAEPLAQFKQRLEEAVGQPVESFAFGAEEVQRVGIISGAAGEFYPAVVEAGCDTFINGDLKENLVREYEEVGLNHLYAGHYATERFGPRALGEWCRDELGAEVRFIDIPNSV